MKVTQDNVADRQVALTIELESPEVEKYLDRAYKKLAQRMVVPGFRRGKTPRWMVEQLVGKNGLLDEALEFLLPDATEKAMKQENIAWSAPPSVDVAQRDPVVIKATVPLEPTVELGDYTALRVPQDPVNVDETQVDKALESLRKEQAPWEIAGRPVHSGDLVNIDLAGSIDGSPFFKQDNMPYIVSLDSDIPLPGFAAALVTLKPQQVSEFDLPIPSDYADKNVAGKMCHLTVKINEVKEQKLPELNDEFAKKAGSGFESVEALKEQLRKNLVANESNRARQAYEDKVIHAAIEQAKIELPPLLVKHEARHMLEEQVEAMARQGLKFADYMARTGKSLEDVEKEFEEPARDRLTHSLIIRKIADAENIEVSSEEINTELAAMVRQVEQQSGGRSRLQESQASRDAIGRIRRSRKALDRLVAITQAKADAAEAPTSPQ